MDGYGSAVPEGRKTDSSGKKCTADEQDSDFEIKNKNSSSRRKHQYGRWAENEDLVYVKFIKDQEQTLAAESMWNNEFFQNLSRKLKFRRTPKQCKNHHHKMLRIVQTHTVEAIATYIESKYRSRRLAQEEKRKKFLRPSQNGNECNSMGFKVIEDHLNNCLSLVINVEVELIDEW